MELSLNEKSVYHGLCAGGDQQVEGECDAGLKNQ